MNLEARKSADGRSLFIGKSGSLYVSCGYSVCRSDDRGETWVVDCEVPAHGLGPFIPKVRLGARMLRLNLQAMQVLPDGSRVVVARDGIYRAEAGEVRMRRTWQVTRGSRPINLSADGDRVLFGEYGGPEMDRLPVRIHCSEDCGRGFEPVYELPPGEIHHFHNVVVDRYAGHYWVLAGDHGRTPGIAALSKDFRNLEWVARGNQMVRAASVLVRPDCLIYGTDSEMEPNYIIRLDKKTGRCDQLMPIDGSSLYAADFGKTALISTCVEPSRVNKSRSASIYASNDDSNWKRLLSLPKDSWNGVLFQYGVIVFPYVEDAISTWGMFSGQALQNFHDRICIFEQAGDNK